MNHQKENIGVIGLGIMGKPMAKNLLNAGYNVTVFNRSSPSMDELSNLGAHKASSPKDVAAKSDIIITMLPDTHDVKTVILGNNGIMEGASENNIIIDMSTISPQVTIEIAQSLKNNKLFMLDAPVSGGDTGAINGTLSIMVGGDKNIFDQAYPILDVLGKNIVHMGENGKGQMTKLCNQVVVAINMEAVCESLILGAKSGLDLNKLLKAIGAGAAGSWALSNLAPRILAKDLNPGFMVKHQQKDLRLALSLAEDLSIPLPCTSLLHQFFRSIEAEGNGKLGTHSLIRYLEKLSDFKLT